MHITIKVEDAHGETSILRNMAGGRLIDGDRKPPVNAEVLGQAIDSIEKAYKEENNARS